MHIIGIETQGLGYNNQMRGVVMSGAKECKRGKKVPVSRKALLKGLDGTLLHPKNFASLTDFEKAVQASIDVYLKENKAPDFVILPFDHANGESENQDVDVLSLAVKDAFTKHGHNVKTMVMASNLYDYQNVDLIHVGKHLLSAKDEQVLQSSPKLQAKVVETLGVPSNISWSLIKNLAHLPPAEKILEKYGTFKKVLSGNLLYGKDAAIEKNREKKNVLFSLGGITDNGAIGFSLKDAEKLFISAIALTEMGYNVIFTNSPRTPSDVTDYLFEKCRDFNNKGKNLEDKAPALYQRYKNCHMEFFNSKKIAQNDEEAKNFRNYSGKYKAEFEKQAKSIGNIYPAVLNICEFVVNTHDSFSYTSDAAALGIPSVVYTGNYIDKERRPDCYKLFDLCHQKGYVISLDEAL
ncbi:MAG: hypothetical protein IJ870_01395 [Alphaproteobacteria bacterium]|nr:hypothetical protein [Alphaproteobacteria bacterium]